MPAEGQWQSIRWQGTFRTKVNNSAIKVGPGAEAYYYFMT